MPIGAIAGAAIGGIGSLIGGHQESQDLKAAGNKAADLGLTGFNYLKNSPLATSYLPQGAAANGQIAALLGVGGDSGVDPAVAANAFQNYQNSTGTQFMLHEGQNATTSSNAARGLLNSGATLKALTKYGQQLGNTTFSNYLTQLGGLSASGLKAGGAIGDAATYGGGQAARAIGDLYGKAADASAEGTGGTFSALGKIASFLPGKF